MLRGQCKGKEQLHGQTWEGRRRWQRAGCVARCVRAGEEGRGQVAWAEMGGEGKGCAHLSAMRAAARDEGQ